MFLFEMQKAARGRPCVALALRAAPVVGLVVGDEVEDEFLQTLLVARVIPQQLEVARQFGLRDVFGTPIVRVELGLEGDLAQAVRPQHGLACLEYGGSCA